MSSTLRNISVLDRPRSDDLLGVAASKVDDNRLYRGLDELLPLKEKLEVFLKERFGSLFGIEYDLHAVRRDEHDILRDRQKRIRSQKRAVTRATIDPIASKSASAWWSRRVAVCRWDTKSLPEIATTRRR